MKNKLKEIEMFGMIILPEYFQTLHAILTTNPKWSKKRIFETLFEVGEKKHSRGQFNKGSSIWQELHQPS